VLFIGSAAASSMGLATPMLRWTVDERHFEVNVFLADVLTASFQKLIL